MEHLDSEQVYRILQNLSNLEISYLEYSRLPKNFVEYKTYIDYFNNYVIKSRNLIRFYFPYPIDGKNSSIPRYISELGTITDLLTIVPGYDFSISKQFNFPDGLCHNCNYYTLIYVMEGHGQLDVNEISLEIKEGDFCLIPPYVDYSLNTRPESICLCFNMRSAFVAAEHKSIFQYDSRLSGFVARSLEPDTSMSWLILHTDNSIMLRKFVLQIFAEYINQENFSNNSMRNYLSLMFIAILRDTNTKLESSAHLNHSERCYQQILEYLKQNYQTATLSDVSEQIHFSKQYICRIIKSVSGKTFNSLLMEIRLSIVCQYLADSNLTLESIAELCGFSATSHLSKVFKECYGMTPTAYRRENRKST